MDERKGKPARGLGRGLSALLGEDADAAPAAAPKGTRPVAIELLHRGRFQPRRQFDAEQIAALAESIRSQGVLQPLLVRPHPDRPGEYEILAGERRWRAAQQAGLPELPVLVRELGDREALEIALVENVQRQDLNPIEEARGYHRLHEEFGHTQEEIARVTGKSRPHIANMLRLLTLPAEIASLVEEGKLTVGHVRPLIGHDDALAIARDAIARQLSVRDVERLIRAASPAEGRAPPQAPAAHDPNLRALERDLETLLGMKTKIVDQGGKGSISFRYSSLDQFDALLKRLGNA